MLQEKAGIMINVSTHYHGEGIIISKLIALEVGEKNNLRNTEIGR